MEYTKFELDASKKGWRCSECGLFVDAIGRAVFGQQPFEIKMHTNSWLENRPEFLFCPNCGRPVRSGSRA